MNSRIAPCFAVETMKDDLRRMAARAHGEVVDPRLGIPVYLGVGPIRSFSKSLKRHLRVFTRHLTLDSSFVSSFVRRYLLGIKGCFEFFDTFDIVWTEIGRDPGVVKHILVPGCIFPVEDSRYAYQLQLGKIKIGFPP